MSEQEPWLDVTFAALRDGSALPEEWHAPSAEELRRWRFNRQLGLVETAHRLLHSAAFRIPHDEIASSHTKEVIDKLKRVADARRAAGFGVVGLAAQQIGIDAAIFLADVEISTRKSDMGALQPFINPRISPIGASKQVEYESCLSVPCLGARFERPQKVGVVAYQPSGEQFHVESEGYRAVILQHEGDHLNGIQFPDRALAQQRPVYWRMSELQDQFASVRAGELHEWPTCSERQWQAMRLGGFSLDRFILPGEA